MAVLLAPGGTTPGGFLFQETIVRRRSQRASATPSAARGGDASPGPPMIQSGYVLGISRFQDSLRHALPTLADVHLRRALESHFPRTFETVEGPFELVLDESPPDGLPAYRASKRAIFPNSPANLLGLALERGATCHNLSKDGQRDGGWLAWTSRCRCGATPLAVIWTTSIAGLRR